MRVKGKSLVVAPPIASEYEEQKALCSWLDLKGILYFAIPNGGTRNIIEAAKLKRTGVKPGVPDLFIAMPRGKYHGCFVEMKRVKHSVVSDHQKKWVWALREQGFYVEVANGVYNAMDIINNYFCS